MAANTKFCFDLFQEISKDDPHKNIFFCPLSLSAALGMVRLGARSESAQQIDQVWLRYLWVHPQSQTLVLLLQAMMLTEPGAWGGGGKTAFALEFSFTSHLALSSRLSETSASFMTLLQPPQTHNFSQSHSLSLCVCLFACISVLLLLYNYPY